MRLAWKITLIALVALWIGEAASGFLAGWFSGCCAATDPAGLATVQNIGRGFSYAVQSASVLLAFLLFRNAAPADTSRLTRFLLMAQGFLMTVYDLPLSRFRGRPLWPYVIFVPAGMALFHLARTRLARD